MRDSRGNVQLSLYTLVGLISIDPSWQRSVLAIVVSAVILAWISQRLDFDENVQGSWRWSPATSRGVSVFALVAVGALLPFLTGGQSSPSSDRIASFLVANIFATMIGLAVYLSCLLEGTTGPKARSLEIESLKLEHQACMTLFQTFTVAVATFFVGVILSVALDTGKQFGHPVSSLLCAFYYFSGAIIWLIRPCLARAKYIRFLIEQPTREPDTTQRLTRVE
jgi:hypothetical protein